MGRASVAKEDVGGAVGDGEEAKDEEGGRRSDVACRTYLFKLHLSPLANIGVGIEGCDDATSNGSGIHLEELTRGVACSRGMQVVGRGLETAQEMDGEDSGVQSGAKGCRRKCAS